MSLPYLVNKSGDLFTVITSTALIAHNATATEAYTAILNSFPWLSGPAVQQSLDSPNQDSARWRSTWAAATGSQLQSLREDLEQLPTTETTEALADKLGELQTIIATECERVEELHRKQQAELNRQRLIESKKHLLHRCEQRATKVKTQIAKAVRTKGEFYDNLNGEFRHFLSAENYADCWLAATPLGEQIAKLKTEIGGL